MSNIVSAYYAIVISNIASQIAGHTKLMDGNISEVTKQKIKMAISILLEELQRAKDMMKANSSIVIDFDTLKIIPNLRNSFTQILENEFGKDKPNQDNVSTILSQIDVINSIESEQKVLLKEERIRNQIHQKTSRLSSDEDISTFIEDYITFTQNRINEELDAGKDTSLLLDRVDMLNNMKDQHKTKMLEKTAQSFGTTIQEQKSIMANYEKSNTQKLAFGSLARPQSASIQNNRQQLGLLKQQHPSSSQNHSSNLSNNQKDFGSLGKHTISISNHNNRTSLLNRQGSIQHKKGGRLV